MARQQRTVGNQRVLALLRHLHHVYVLRIVGIHVAQVDIDKLHARHDLELFLYATATLDRVVEQPLDVVFIHGLVGEQQLGQTAKGLAHGNLVTLVEIAVEPKEAVDKMRVVATAHLLAKLRQTIGNKAVVPRKQARAHLGDLPSGQRVVDAVEERRVVVELRWERVKEVCGLEHVLHRIVDIALEHHRGIGVDLIAAARVAAACHVILHDLHGIGVAKAHAGDLVKRHAIPMAHQAHAVGTHGVHAAKEVCRGGLATREQNRVGRDLLVDMALARTARTQLAQVVVMLDQRNHALNKVQALALGELVRLVAGRAQQHVEPLVAREVLAALDHLVQIEVGHLNGCEAHYAKRRILGPALLFLGAVARRDLVAKDIGPKLIELGVGAAVLDAHDAPNSAL